MDISAQTISSTLQLIIQGATLITLIYALFKFLGTPNRTQDERIALLESRITDIDQRLHKGDIHFTVIDEGNKVTQRAILALIDHGINGNDIDKLKRAKADLEDYLTDR